MYFGLIVPAYGYGEHGSLCLVMYLLTTLCVFSVLRAQHYQQLWIQRHPHTAAIGPSLGMRVCNGNDHCNILRPAAKALPLHHRLDRGCAHGIHHPARCARQHPPSVRGPFPCYDGYLLRHADHRVLVLYQPSVWHSSFFFISHTNQRCSVWAPPTCCWHGLADRLRK